MVTTTRQQRSGLRLARATTTGLAICVALVATAVGALGPAPAVAADVSAVYVPFGPQRFADTRRHDCGCSRLDANTISVDIAGHSDIPDDIVAVAVTITATPTPGQGYVTLYPGETTRPTTSVLNTRPDRTVANSAILEVGDNGAITLYQSAPSDLIVDVTGLFLSADTSRAGRFQPVPTRRLADTRQSTALVAGGELTVPIPPDVPADATALALNVTSVGERLPGHLTGRAAGSPLQETSFVNMNGSGHAVAATVILPASSSGVTITSHAGGHVVVDLLGYFTGPSAADSGIGLFVPVGPQRLLDTRQTRPRIWSGGTLELPVAFATAGALVTNVTATLSDRAGYVTAHPAGTPLPDTSTINPSRFDHTLANQAITQVSTRGLAYYSTAGVDLVVDVTGLFTGTPVAATQPASTNAPGAPSRVLAVGDSTLAALHLYNDSQRALIGFEGIIDGMSCRRLSRPSCKSGVTGVTPNTAVEAILGTPGRLDIVVVKTGYNDWSSDFPAEFDHVVNAARAKGAHTILWLSYAEGVNRATAKRAYQENNADLYHLVTLPQYSDVVLADWRHYTTVGDPGNWTWDGSHLTQYGSWLTTDYISRWVAALEHRPCPRPWGPGGPQFDPCPVPDALGPVPQVTALY